MYEKSKLLFKNKFNQSILKKLYEDKNKIAKTIDMKINKIKKIFDVIISLGLIVFFATACIIGIISKENIFLCLGIVIITVVIGILGYALCPLLENYFEKKLGLKYKNNEILVELSKTSIRKDFLNYIEEVNETYPNKDLNYLIRDIKLEMIEGNQTNIVNKAEKILHLIEKVELENDKIKAEDLKLLRYNQTMGIKIATKTKEVTEIEFEKELKEIL